MEGQGYMRVRVEQFGIDQKKGARKKTQAVDFILSTAGTTVVVTLRRQISNDCTLGLRRKPLNNNEQVFGSEVMIGLDSTFIRFLKDQIVLSIGRNNTTDRQGN